MTDADLASADRGPSIIALSWPLGGVACFVVVLRFVGRVMIHQIGWDDWAMLFTLVMYLGTAAFTTALAVYGGFKHTAYIPPEDLSNALRFNWAAQAFVIFGYATGKLSVGLLILRLIGPHTKVRKYIIYISLILSFVFSSLNIIFTFAQCTPPRALWEPQLLQTGEAKCWDPSIQGHFALFLGCWNVVVDATLAVLPFSIFYRLQMPLHQKISCSALLGLGLLAAIFGAIKAADLGELTARSDLTWETYPLLAWSCAELFVLIVCGSIPPIKPVYEYLVHNKRQSPRSYAAQNTFSERYRKGGHKKRSTPGQDFTDPSDMDLAHAGQYTELSEMERTHAYSDNGGIGLPENEDTSRGILKTTDIRVSSHKRGGDYHRNND